MSAQELQEALCDEDLPRAKALVAAGADPCDLSFEETRLLLDLGEIRAEGLDSVSPDDFRAGSARVFGRENPERMQCPFWEAMIRAGINAYAARAHFGVSRGDVSWPVWCAQRYGQSLTFLPDGRAIQIGGSHEDYYDADFCIYNDVFVHGPEGGIAIYGYPESVFPPTDFHSATLVGDSIYIIGSAGYAEKRVMEETLVFRLSISTLRMERLETQGAGPGLIYLHRAQFLGTREIRICGGKRCGKRGEAPRENDASFVLDLERLAWKQEQGSLGAT